MSPAPIVLFCLLLTSLVLMVMLAVAWRCFGRPRAAIIWSGMFGLFGAGWAVNLGGVLFAHSWQFYFPIVEAFADAAALALVGGALARGGQRFTPLLPLGLVAVGAVMLTIAGAMLDSDALSDPPGLAFSALCSAFMAVIVHRGRGSRSEPERLVTAVLALVALFYLVSAVLAATLPIGPQNLRLVFYRLVILLGVPPSSMALGFSCIFLIASDLAEQMRHLAATDALTGVFNRRGLGQAAEPLIAVCRRQGQPLAVVLIDLDRFKAVNDQFGHAAGDAALSRFADYAASSVRRGDLVARLGGEEFGILLPNTNAAKAAEAMERLRVGLAAVNMDGVAPITLTASFGVAAVERDDDGLDPALARADAALYAAKQAGRDRVVLAGAESEGSASAVEPNV
ncbi:MAG: GGDEF domain-containing protein [Sphingomonadaceae bacterium]|nr:GGDEF domain-containing protein [Sphingomonadaceae bacterium]